MKTRILLLALFIAVAPRLTAADVFYTDGLETQVLKKTGAGFLWADTTSVSIVTMHPTCGGFPDGTPTSVFNGSVICNGTSIPAGGGDWYAKTGDYSLRFRYAATGVCSNPAYTTQIPCESSGGGVDPERPNVGATLCAWHCLSGSLDQVLVKGSSEL